MVRHAVASSVRAYTVHRDGLALRGLSPILSGAPPPDPPAPGFGSPELRAGRRAQGWRGCRALPGDRPALVIGQSEQAGPGRGGPGQRVHRQPLSASDRSHCHGTAGAERGRAGQGRAVTGDVDVMCIYLR